MANLVIVESPAKAKTIEKYLGRKYKVVASVGHVRDLPKSDFGIDVENGYAPKYISIRGKSQIINGLKKDVKNAEKVFLATDPDREGEAISWHLCSLLGLDPAEKNRITFNEITKNAVNTAIKNPTVINQNLVDAQQARRVLDRIVGYKLSPFLWKKVKKGLSAGRVQSVATALIVDREKEIRDFVPQEYWTLDGIFTKTDSSRKMKARFYGTEQGRAEIHCAEEAERLYQEIVNSQFAVRQLKEGTKPKSPAPPFTTSTLQQEASKRLNFQARRTMKAAQELYEGVEVEGEGLVGLITYMRTDSMRISDDAAAAAKDFIIRNYGKEYYPSRRRIYRTKKNAQDAHEAIRPTTMHLTPESVRNSLSMDQYRIYKLIYERFIASQMSDAVYDTVSASFTDGKYVFKFSAQSLKFAGYSKVYADTEKQETSSKLPKLVEGDALKLTELIKEQNFTQPPARYTEASLIKALEEAEVGRPSTYVPIITTILAREYVERDGKNLRSTALGEIITELMKENFPDIVDCDFTAKIEKKLDTVEDGKVAWQKVIDPFYKEFSVNLKRAEDKFRDTKVKVPDEVTEEICPHCGKNLVIKSGRFGKFLACPGYPECKFTKAIIIDTGVPCPKCGGKILQKRSKAGKTYYGCEHNPTCDFMTWDIPQKETCPHCGKNLYRRNNRYRQVYCANTACPSAKKADDKD